jgi:hypothetical protein
MADSRFFSETGYPYEFDLDYVDGIVMDLWGSLPDDTSDKEFQELFEEEILESFRDQSGREDLVYLPKEKTASRLLEEYRQQNKGKPMGKQLERIETLVSSLKQIGLVCTWVPSVKELHIPVSRVQGADDVVLDWDQIIETMDDLPVGISGPSRAKEFLTLVKSNLPDSNSIQYAHVSGNAIPTPTYPDGNQIPTVPETTNMEIEMSKEETDVTEPTEPTKKEIGVDLLKTMGAALAHGGEIAFIGKINGAARDRLMPFVPEAHRDEDYARNGMLVLPPAVVLGLLDYAPAFGITLPIPEKGIKLARGRAVTALEHAGIENSKVLVEKAMEYLLPILLSYAMEMPAEASAPSLLGASFNMEDAVETVREKEKVSVSKSKA